MGDLSYRTEEKIETPQDVRAREKEERRRQIEFDLRQGMRRGIGLPKTKIEGVTHVFDDGTLRSEKLKKEQEEQSAHDFADGSRLNLRRIGWA
ncbi:MAG: hypothetical protein KAW47_00225 [Thermoplasmatales archaeon]|nr:hypothetical protein [Thermoplasmatales archaeon]